MRSSTLIFQSRIKPRHKQQHYGRIDWALLAACMEDDSSTVRHISPAEQIVATLERSKVRHVSTAWSTATKALALSQLLLLLTTALLQKLLLYFVVCWVYRYEPWGVGYSPYLLPARGVEVIQFNTSSCCASFTANCWLNLSVAWPSWVLSWVIVWPVWREQVLLVWFQDPRGVSFLLFQTRNVTVGWILGCLLLQTAVV